MEQKYYWIIGIIAVLGLFFISGCVQQTKTSNVTLTHNTQIDNCRELSKNFDARIDTISVAECDKWVTEGNKPIWVGGKLINVSKTYITSYKRNEFTLIFQGSQKQGKIYIGTKNESIPYEISKFYKFDLGNKCKLIYSMTSSGMFLDPNLDTLEYLQECDFIESIQK